MKQLVIFAAITSTLFVGYSLYTAQSISQDRASDGSTRIATPVAERISSAVTSPLPLQLSLDPAKVNLGEKLFHDPLLSSDGSISCASCHDLAAGGTINKARATGVRGQLGRRNPPTVFNSEYNLAQFWDGRSRTLEDQMEKPMLDPVEMDSNWPDVLAKLKSNAHYVNAFKAIYSDGISKQSVSNAIATFERSLVTPNSRFDQYLRGDSDALMEYEKQGYELFVSLGCASCHQGINLGGNLFQKFGLFKEPQKADGDENPDYGRFEITGDEADKYVFKVPSLRNVVRTAPYFHDGSVPTLEIAIRMMAEYQLGRTLSNEEIEKICGFLSSLTGEYKGKPL